MKNCYCEKIIFDKVTAMRTYTIFSSFFFFWKKFYCQNNFCGKQLPCRGGGGGVFNKHCLLSLFSL